MTEEHPRKCSNLLADFLKWTIPRSAAKESYIFWTGLFTMSSVLRRHVKVGKEYLGSWECYPYLYLLFLGPAGNLKTTTVNYNLDLLNEVGGLTPAPDQLTVPKLASMLTEAEECSMYINAGELSEFIAKSGVDMYSFLTRAFDGQKTLSVGTHMRDIELSEKPCINFLGASTVETLVDILPQSVLDGGFGRRCIFIYEEDVRRRKLMYTDVPVVEIYNQYFPNLVHDLKYIANNLFGNFKLTDDAVNKFEQWFIDGAGFKKNGNRISNRLSGYYQTKPAFVMKVAMMLKIADGNVIHKDQLILDWKTIEEAITIVESTEANMHMVLGNVGKNVYKNDTKNMMQFISDNEPIKLSQLLQEFSAVAEPTKLGELIQGMSNAGMISLEPSGLDKNAEILIKVRKK